MTISDGDKVEGFSFTDHAGTQWRYPGDFEARAALFFLRHLGCPLCRHRLEELSGKAPEFESRGIKLFAVVESTQKRAEQYAEEHGIKFPLVPDRERTLYELFEVKRGGLKEFLAPRAAAATMKAALKGHMHGRFEGSELQVPATFLLSPEGTVIRAHYGKDVSDFGDIDAMLAGQ